TCRSRSHRRREIERCVRRNDPETVAELQRSSNRQICPRDPEHQLTADRASEKSCGDDQSQPSMSWNRLAPEKEQCDAGRDEEQDLEEERDHDPAITSGRW